MIKVRWMSKQAPDAYQAECKHRAIQRNQRLSSTFNYAHGNYTLFAHRDTKTNQQISSSQISPEGDEITHLMNINSRITQRVMQHVQELTRRRIAVPRRLVPRVAAREAVPRREDELRGAGAANAVDRCLVVLQQQVSRLADGGGGSLVKMVES